MSDAKKSFVVNAKKYFGLLPGQSLAEFSAEIRALGPGDKKELAKLLNEIPGYPTKIPE